MSYRALNWAWEADLPMPQKFVLVALADMADEKDSCYPGQERLARMTGTSVSTVRRAVKALEDMGALSRQARGLAGGGRTSDRYALNTNRSFCTDRGNRSDEGGIPVTLTVETGHSDRGTPREPSEEPSDTVARLLDVLWMMWPLSRRSTRKVVEKSLRTALKSADAPTLIEAVKAHTDVWSTWPAGDEQYVPLLSTWLNQERWTGAVPQPRGGARLSPVDMGRAAAELLAVEDTRHLRALS